MMSRCRTSRHGCDRQGSGCSPTSRGALLLSTSNRSEAAVGYATMDGDTSGGLAPIAGIDKAWLRQWLVWLEKQGPEGLSPIPALAAVNAQAPTAELRPQESGQTDEADLMPYPLLDAIERAAIRDKQSPLEAFRCMRLVFPQYGARPARHLGGEVLPPLVPQPVEARALRAKFSPRRRELGSEDVVPVSHSQWRL
jgi:NH3-dependent NAD+ synthetase